MRTGRVGGAFRVMIVVVGAALVATGCGGTARPAGTALPGTLDSPASPTTSGAPGAPVSSGARTGSTVGGSGPTVPPPVAGTDDGSLIGTWVADDGDVLVFARTAPGTYRGTVLYASHCAPGAGPVVVTSQAAGRFAGTGPLESTGTGWCGSSRSLESVTIVLGAGRSTAQVSGSGTGASGGGGGGGGGGQSWARSTLSVTGQVALPGPNDEDQAEGSPALAQTCDKATFEADEAHGAVIAASFRLGREPTAAALLTHFLGGSGSPVDYPAGSAVASEAARSAPFASEDQRVRTYLEGRLGSGRAAIDLGQAQGVLDTIGFTDQSIPDLYWGFRATQGLDVSGAGAVFGGDLLGELTYVIRDAYGFGLHDYLSGFGPEMRYLQTTCGAPYYPGGARWFTDSVTVTVGLRVPVAARG